MTHQLVKEVDQAYVLHQILVLTKCTHNSIQCGSGEVIWGHPKSLNLFSKNNEYRYF